MTETTASHGRHAGSPTEIPKRGWKEILWRVKDQITKDRVTLVAGGVTYYLLLALVPALTALVSIYGLFSDPTTVQSHLSALEGVIPGGGMEIVGEQMERIASQESGSLSLAFAGSLLISLWSANAGVKAMFQAMNVAYEEKEKRGFFKLNLVSLTFTVSVLVLIALLVGVLVVLPIVLGAFGLGAASEWLVRIASYALMAGLAYLGIAALYRWGPSRDKPEWRWVNVGVIVALVVWVIASGLFSWYAANLGSFNATYGSLGSLIGFLLWMWISVIIVIVGAELNSETERQTTADTTVGADKPMGARGAKMADTVAGEGKREGG